MRQRLSQADRKNDILKQAIKLFHQRGYGQTEMEDIRLACGISRGGLYHHFGNKGAILDAIVADEIRRLCEGIEGAAEPPIEALLTAGSSALGNEAGIVLALSTKAEKLLYLSSLDLAVTSQLSPLLTERLAGFVRAGADPNHVAELFLTVNAHINRRIILEDWTAAQGAGFAATALEALQPFLENPAPLGKIIQTLRSKGQAR